MEGFIKFFGSGGARFVAATQVRATGGLWLNYKETNLFVDPGPGAVVRIHASKERFDPSRLDGILLTHKHLDHSNDVNILIEAMTEGGFKKRGTLFCPEDAVSGDPVVMKYVTAFLEGVEVLKEKKTYTLKDMEFVTPARHIHGVETYGVFFRFNPVTVAIISDTRYFDALPDLYQADYLIVNVLRTQPIDRNGPLDHLSLDDFVELITKIKPKVAIMTHFGLTMIRAKPYLLAERLKKENRNRSNSSIRRPKVSVLGRVGGGGLNSSAPLRCPRYYWGSRRPLAGQKPAEPPPRLAGCSLLTLGRYTLLDVLKVRLRRLLLVASICERLEPADVSPFKAKATQPVSAWGACPCDDPTPPGQCVSPGIHFL